MLKHSHNEDLFQLMERTGKSVIELYRELQDKYIRLQKEFDDKCGMSRK